MESRQPLGSAGSSGRALSLPPGNPFWSDRAWLEWEVQQRRPLELPSVETEEVRAVNLPVPQDEEFREAAQALGYLQRSGQRAEGQVTGQEWG